MEIDRAFTDTDAKGHERGRHETHMSGHHAEDMHALRPSLIGRLIES